MTRSLRTFAGLFALIAAACSAKDSGPPFPDVSSFCAGRAKAECTTEVVTACALPSVERCITGRAAACSAEHPSGTVYTASQAEPCLNQLSTAYQDAKVTDEEHRATATACNLVFDGTGMQSAACMRDGDCVQSAGLRCAQGAASATGTCQVPKLVQGGGSCAPLGSVCVEGFHCGNSSHCDVNAAVGEACTASLPCAPDALCNAAGTCQAKAADGSACTSDDSCSNGICARASGVSEGICVKQVILAPNEPFCVDARAMP